MPHKEQVLSSSKVSKPSKSVSEKMADFTPEIEVASEAEQANLNFSDPRYYTPKNILALQRTIGNQAVQRMIASHKAQQPGQASRQIARTQVGSSPRGVIQRHASHEHKMLGDVNPADLEIIAASSNLKGNKAVTEKEGEDDVELKISGTDKTITKGMVLHTLEQEINRIKFFRDHPPKTDKGDTRSSYTTKLKKMDKESRVNVAEESGTEGAVEKAVSVEWDVVIVSIPSTKRGASPLLVTYGEMNTLADIYGNVDELKKADPKNRWEVLQGIRQLSLFNYMDIYDKVSGKSNFSSKANPSRLGEGFSGATGVTGRGGGTVGELRFIMGGKKKQKGKEEQDYTAGLGRNACHFAPESWYSWAKYHRDAEKLAQQAYAAKKKAQSTKLNKTKLSPEDQEKITGFKAEQEGLENDALLANGFGDHFLQDSYAAGHLINKTQVMKWFVEWMDNHPYQVDFTKDENWRKNQAIAYDQDTIGHEDERYDVSNVGKGMLAKDPQSVENIEGSDQNGWVSRFNAIGLKLPNSVNSDRKNFDFTIWWQGRAANWYRTRGLKLSDVPDKFSEDYAIKALKQMIQEGVARVNWTGSSPSQKVIEGWNTEDWKSHSFLLNPDYVPSDSKKFATLVDQMNSQDPATSKKAKEEYNIKGAKVTYKNYHEFLGNSLLQAGTNILHNHFCNNGITVKSGEDVDLGRIYGDYKMLAKDSSVGVKYSATTSHMSRDAIIETYTTGKTTKTTDSIAKRFPTQAALVDKDGAEGAMVPLDQWSKGLKALLDNKIFGEAQNSLPARAGGIKGNDLGKISKDVDVHQGSIF